MSGGHFDYVSEQVAYHMSGQWHDEELNELFHDLFGDGWDKDSDFGPRGGGLAESLDFWLSGDTIEDEYREEVTRFKAKWLCKKTPRNRVEYYQRRFEQYAQETMERFKRELGEV